MSKAMDLLRLEFQFPALPERLWQALTDPAKLAVWLAENDFSPEPGRRFTLATDRLAGLDGPVSGIVLAADKPRQLIMGWQVGPARATVTWTIEAASGGSRLLVSQDGILGTTGRAILEETYRQVYGDQLRSVLARKKVVLAAEVAEPAVSMPDERPQVFPALGPPHRSRGGSGRGGPTPGDRPGNGPPGAPPARRRVGIWPPVLAAALLALAAAAWLVTSVLAHPATDPDAAHVVPTVTLTSDRPAVVAVPTAAPGAVPGAAPTSPARTASAPSGPPAETGSGTAPGVVAKLAATFEKLPQGLLTYNVKVTVANSGTGAGTWKSVTATLDGVNLMVTPFGTGVTHTDVGGKHCFTPVAALASVPAGGTVTFSFAVKSLLPDVLGTINDVGLDTAPCTP